MRFSVGDRVRTRNENPEGHTRLPTYLRAREGRIERELGAFPLPDARARGDRGAPKETLYTVRFAAEAVWGRDAKAPDICADLFEPYLEKVQ
jgi:nitrile hydratase